MSSTNLSQTPVGNPQKPRQFDDFLDKVICGDSANVLFDLPEKSIDTVVTSPPYFNQRDYGTSLGGERSVDEYITGILRVFLQCARIVKDTGSVFINMGDKYADSSLLLIPYLFAKRAHQESGLKLINQITWVKPNPEPRQFKRRLVSATEPIFHFVKTENYRYFPDRFLEGLQANRESKDYRNGRIGGKYFDLIDKAELDEKEKQAALAELQQVIQEVKDGKIWSFRMKIRGIHSAAYGGYEGGRRAHIRLKGFTIIRMYDRPLKRDVIETPILNERFLNHPAIYPETLVRECLNLTTESGDVVLDPFLGSGTTAVVAKSMGRRYVGVDTNQEFCELARTRLRETPAQTNLFEFIA